MQADSAGEAELNPIRRIHSRLIRSASLAVSGHLLAGFALIAATPRKSTLEARLATIPTTGVPIARPVTIHWNNHQVPFIVAESDDDAAFALGLVHAHLRLGQMAIFRSIAKGRIAEMCGPAATDIDHGLRILNVGRAVPAMLTSMPPASRRWLDRFVDGVNHYQGRIDTRLSSIEFLPSSRSRGARQTFSLLGALPAAT